LEADEQQKTTAEDTNLKKQSVHQVGKVKGQISTIKGGVRKFFLKAVLSLTAAAFIVATIIFITRSQKKVDDTATRNTPTINDHPIITDTHSTKYPTKASFYKDSFSWQQQGDPVLEQLSKKDKDADRTPSTKSLRFPQNALNAVEGSNTSKTTTIQEKRSNGIIWTDSKKGTYTDKRDGTTYRVIKIGGQVWTAENLKYKTPNSKPGKFGREYMYNDAKKAAPPGWHIPTKKEFEQLIAYLGGEEKASKALRPFGNGSCGFNALFDDDNSFRVYTSTYAGFGGVQYIFSLGDNTLNFHKEIDMFGSEGPYPVRLIQNK